MKQQGKKGVFFKKGVCVPFLPRSNIYFFFGLSFFTLASPTKGGDKC